MRGSRLLTWLRGSQRSVGEEDLRAGVHGPRGVSAQVASPPRSQAQERTHARLFIPCRQGTSEDWTRNLQGAGLVLRGGRLSGDGIPFSARVEWIDNPADGSFGAAFSFGTTTEEEQRIVDAATGALVLHLPVDLHRQRAGVVQLVRGIAPLGALAVRVEESKLGFMLEKWLSLVGGEDPWSLYRAVVVVLTSGDQAATRGMHAFSLPDAQVAIDPDTTGAEANTLLGVLNVYQIAEDPLLLSGHTFSPDPDSPRRTLVRWPDAVYPRGHACHNPFGVWRVGAAGTTGKASTKLAFVFMPSLVALLAALERRQGRPLTEEQVREATSTAVGITMEHRDARELERSRGYAELDADLAWDQWQVARRGP